MSQKDETARLFIRCRQWTAPAILVILDRPIGYFVEQTRSDILLNL